MLDLPRGDYSIVNIHLCDLKGPRIYSIILSRRASLTKKNLKKTGTLQMITLQ